MPRDQKPEDRGPAFAPVTDDELHGYYSDSDIDFVQHDTAPWTDSGVPDRTMSQQQGGRAWEPGQVGRSS